MTKGKIMAEAKTPLPDENFEAVSGGADTDNATPVNAPACPKCGGTDVMLVDTPDRSFWHCYDCGYEWDYS